jgi:hypothetical protein
MFLTPPQNNQIYSLSGCATLVIGWIRICLCFFPAKTWMQSQFHVREFVHCSYTLPCSGHPTPMCLKGQCHEICFRFFSWIIFPKPLKITFPFPKFAEIFKSQGHHGINDTGSKFDSDTAGPAGVNTTVGKLPRISGALAVNLPC